jgi:four helix bundle protein
MQTDLKHRTKDFAVRIIRLFAALPKSVEAQVIGKQILRSGTSVGAHYRESQFAKSDADFISKIEGGLQELEETAYWLELLDEMQLFSAEKLRTMRKETSELTAIFITIVKK